jgi:hypothetical protein
MAIASTVCTVASQQEKLGKKDVEFGTLTPTEAALEQWANLRFLKYIDTIILQIGAVNGHPGVFLTVKPNVTCVTGAEATGYGSVSFIGTTDFHVSDKIEFVAIGKLVY